MTDARYRMHDIVGIGALNVDFIATSSAQINDPALQEEFGDDFEAGTERPMSREDAIHIINKYNHSFKHSLGGSAFNAINTAYQCSNYLKICCIGVIGTSISDDADFELWFHEHPGMKSFTQHFDDIQGICVSWIREGERTLRTYPGVNTKFGDFLKQKRNDIVNLLVRTKLIHITSLFDDESPAILFNILTETKEKNPLVQISFDPGHYWSCNPSNYVRSIFRISDYIFLNHREFTELGDPKAGEARQETAERILKGNSPNAKLVVLKKYNSISVFFSGSRGIREFS